VTGSQPYSSRLVGRVLVAVVLVGLVVVAGAFLVDAGDRQPDPVSFDRAISFDLPEEDDQALEARGLSVPRVQVFYSQYNYVVGYEGVERAVDVMGRPAHTQQFGYPLTMYVSDYAGTGVEVTADGYLDTTRDPGWVSADEAWFVLGSEARTTVSETIVPFADERAARSFADSYGGSVVRWSELEAADVELSDATAVRATVPERQQRADERVANVTPHLDREISTVVGEDAPTVQAAVAAADPGTTVLVPPGTYEEHVTVDRPVTLRGEGATLDGNGNGTVVEVTHDGAALTGFSITGVGESAQPENATTSGDWDQAVEAAYGHSDAGVHVVDAAGVYLHNLTVETPTSGVVFRDAPDGVVEGLTVNGTETPMEGFMGIVSIRTRLVVQDSVFDGGRDGIYLHRAPGTVVRNSTFLDQRFGVHLMYTSDSLVAGNVARGQSSAGVVIMTSPARNAVVDNDIRYATEGIIPTGSRSYIADNVLAHNENGVMVGTTQSIYERNVIYGNELGARTGSTIPSNVVRRNDFVANDRHATAGMGPLRVWTDGATGNYWEGGHGYLTETVLASGYSPTDPTEGRLHRTDGAVTLAASPAATALAEIRTTSAGLRQGEVADTAPLADPVSPGVIAELRETPPARTTGGETGDG
jgi:nitrous oxidase accessory protein NosD/nitrous oxide reductase accessory protein NosL